MNCIHGAKFFLKNWCPEALEHSAEGQALLLKIEQTTMVEQDQLSLDEDDAQMLQFLVRASTKRQ